MELKNETALNEELHQELSSVHFDFYKEVHGIRPRWFNYKAMSVEQLEEEIKQLKSEHDAQMAWEKELRDQRSRDIQSRKKRNAYKPNLVFSGLRDMIQAN